MSRTAILLVTILSLPLAAAQVVEQPKPSATVAESKWQFEERIDRPDVLYDLEAILAIQKDIDDARDKAPVLIKNPGSKDNSLADALIWLQGEESRIKSMLAERRYDEVVQKAESALRQADRFLSDPSFARVAALISGYRTQAQDALDRMDAEREFRALGIRVEGILWAENGAKLAILSTESAAVGLNQTTKKKATVISIATDRVDFRFHHDRSRRRFEFPVYVGEDSKAAAATTPAR